MLKIVSSKSQKRPLRVCVYGLEGIGKTTFAAGSEKPLYFDLEKGTGQLVGIDVPVVQPTTFKDFLANLAEFPAGDYQTCVIDTADALETLIHAEICAAKGWDSIEDPGWGKGYNIATDRFVHALECLDKLQEKGVQIIVLAHSLVRNFSNPAGADYSRYELTLFKGSSQPGPGPILKAWADCLLFACYADTAKLEKRDQGSDEVLKKGKGITGERVLKTQHAAAWDAKNRLGLPPEIPLSYAAFKAAIAKGDATPQQQKAPVEAPPATAKAAEVSAPKPAEGASRGTTSPNTTPSAITIKEVSAALREYMEITKQGNPAAVGAEFAKPLGSPSISKLAVAKYPDVLKAIATKYVAMDPIPEAPVLSAMVPFKK